MEQPLVNYHLSKTSELKNLIKEQLERGFFINTIAEKLGWPEPLVWAVAPIFYPAPEIEFEDFDSSGRQSFLKKTCCST